MCFTIYIIITWHHIKAFNLKKTGVDRVCVYESISNDHEGACVLLFYCWREKNASLNIFHQPNVAVHSTWNSLWSDRLHTNNMKFILHYTWHKLIDRLKSWLFLIQRNDSWWCLVLFSCHSPLLAFSHLLLSGAYATVCSTFFVI